MQTGVPLQVDYTRVAAHIRDMQPRTLERHQVDDVLTLLEYMRDELIQRDKDLADKTLVIEKRERDVAAREQEVTLLGKTIGLAVQFENRKKRWWNFRKPLVVRSA